MAKEQNPGKDKDDELDDGAVEEVFTDLHGNVDLDEDEDDAEILQTIDEDGGEPPEDEEEETEDAPTSEGGDPVIEQTEPPGEDERDLKLRFKDVELIASRAENLDIRESHFKTAKTNAEKTLTTAAARLKAAKEAGNTDDEIAAQQEWLDARDTVRSADAAFGQIETTRNMLRGELSKLGYDPKTNSFARATAATGTERQRSAPASKHAPAFLKANAAWLQDVKNRAHVEALAAMDKALLAEGKIDKDDLKYFEELGKRFNRYKPGLIRSLDGKLVATGSRQRGNGGGVTPSTGVARQSTDENATKLTNADLKEIRKFGMDPNDKKVRANWLREKRSMARSEARA